MKIHSKDLVNEIAHENSNVKYISTFEEIKEYIQVTAQPNDIILTMGAGSIRTVGEMLVDKA